MPKSNLKDKLDGDQLDLSLSDLSSVPVKDIVSARTDPSLSPTSTRCESDSTILTLEFILCYNPIALLMRVSDG